jgi:hypothetical protein
VKRNTGNFQFISGLLVGLFKAKGERMSGWMRAPKLSGVARRKEDAHGVLRRKARGWGLRQCAFLPKMVCAEK